MFSDHAGFEIDQSERDTSGFVCSEFMFFYFYNSVGLLNIQLWLLQLCLQITCSHTLESILSLCLDSIWSD